MATVKEPDNVQPCSCDRNEMQDLLCTLLDGDITAERADEIRARIAECARCSDRLASELEVRDLVRTCCQSENAPETLHERITSELRTIRSL